MIKITLLTLILAFSAYSQLPDLAKYELIGTTHDKGIAAMIHIEEKNGNKVLFKGLLARILEMKGNDIASLDPNNWSVSTISAECDTHTYVFRDSRGFAGGEKYEKTFEPNVNGSIKGSIMDRAIEKACNGLKDVKGKDGF